MLQVNQSSRFSSSSDLFFTGPYSLSVRDIDEQRGPHVKHYKIRYPDPKIGYFIAARRAFKTLEELIDHYSSNIVHLSKNLLLIIVVIRKFGWSLLSVNTSLSSTKTYNINNIKRCLGSAKKFPSICEKTRSRNVRYDRSRFSFSRS